MNYEIFKLKEMLDKHSISYKFENVMSPQAVAFAKVKWGKQLKPFFILDVMNIDDKGSIIKIEQDANDSYFKNLLQVGVLSKTKSVKAIVNNVNAEKVFEIIESYITSKGEIFNG